MAIITLISDWGTRDHYTAAVKGAILRYNPAITIVDITHRSPVFDIPQAAFILKNAYINFPEGTVHLAAINTDESQITPHVAISHNRHFFVGSDNGLFSLVLGERPEKIIEIEIPQDSDYYTFPARDRFVKAAVHLAENHPIEELGFERDRLYVLHPFQPVVQPSLIIGHVIYIDGYDNVITNITQQIFREVGRNRPFTIQFHRSKHNLRKISKSYSDVSESIVVALFGSTGFLEIAVNQGNAASLLGLRVNDTIRIQFSDEI